MHKCYRARSPDGAEEGGDEVHERGFGQYEIFVTKVRPANCTLFECN